MKVNTLQPLQIRQITNKSHKLVMETKKAFRVFNIRWHEKQKSKTTKSDPQLIKNSDCTFLIISMTLIEMAF